MAQILAPRTEPEVIHASEDRALAVWQELYPDHWLYTPHVHLHMQVIKSARTNWPAAISGCCNRHGAAQHLRLAGVTSVLHCSAASIEGG